MEGLPPIHTDLFDRILIAQSIVEGITLLTVDDLIAQYPAPIRSLDKPAPGARATDRLLERKFFLACLN